MKKDEKFFKDHDHDYLVAHQSGGRLIISNNKLFLLQVISDTGFLHKIYLEMLVK